MTILITQRLSPISRLQGYICNDLQGINSTTSPFHEVLALRPHGHHDHPLTLYDLIRSSISRNSKEPTAVCICKFAVLCCKLLPHCPEVTYLRSISVVDYAIGECNDLPTDVSDDPTPLMKCTRALSCGLTNCHGLSDHALHHTATSTI